MSSDDDDPTASSDIWPCSVCNWTFLSKGALEKHKKSHTNDKPFSCQECHVKFATSSGLKIHMRKHTGERPYKCNHCPKAFTTRSVLNMHMRGHTGEKPYVCKICGASFTQNASLTYHLNKHNKNKQYKCQFCEESFTDLLRRLMHVQKVHYQETCGVCKKKFKTKKGLLAHEEKHAYDTSVQCDLCDKVFPNKVKLIMHIKYHYDSYIKCSVCGKDVSKFQKSRHMKSHNPDQCSVCGRKYVNLKRHIAREHSNLDKTKTKNQDRICKTQFYKFICKICGNRSNKQTSMASHEQKCQLNPPFPQFICDFCQKECPDYQTFEAHVFEHSKVPVKLPFVHEYSNFNPALHVKRMNNNRTTSLKHPRNAQMSLPTSSTILKATEFSDVINSASNETKLTDNLRSPTMPEKCVVQSSGAEKSSSVVDNIDQCKSFQTVEAHLPHQSYVGQNNFQEGQKEEEISIKEESFVEDSFSNFQSEINREMIHYPRQENKSFQTVGSQLPHRSYVEQHDSLEVSIKEEISIKDESITAETLAPFQSEFNPRQDNNTTSFMHNDGIMYIKSERC